MNQRMNLGKTSPEAYKAMLDFDNYLSSTEITPLHQELIRIRASQINGCSYCIDMHTREARKIGETEQRIYALSVWRETPFFTEEERSILALTEEITMIHQHVTDETYNSAKELLGDKYLSQVIMAIIIINSWNRIGVALKMSPEAVLVKSER